jgi:hypothetical protein
MYFLYKSCRDNQSSHFINQSVLLYLFLGNISKFTHYQSNDFNRTKKRITINQKLEKRLKTRETRLDIHLLPFRLEFGIQTHAIIYFKDLVNNTIVVLAVRQKISRTSST